MKNTGPMVLLCLTILFIGLMIGIYIGVSVNKNYITLNYDPAVHTEGAEGNHLQPDIIKININTATAEQLQILPGIGQSTAEAIIAYREKYGYFIKIEDLEKVKGISNNRIKEISKYITVGG